MKKQAKIEAAKAIISEINGAELNDFDGHFTNGGYDFYWKKGQKRQTFLGIIAASTGCNVYAHNSKGILIHIGNTN